MLMAKLEELLGKKGIQFDRFERRIRYDDILLFYLLFNMRFLDVFLTLLILHARRFLQPSQIRSILMTCWMVMKTMREALLAQTEILSLLFKILFQRYIRNYPDFLRC